MPTYRMNYATAELVYQDDYNFYYWDLDPLYRLGGGEEDDSMWGGSQNDYINGSGGDDRILGFGNGGGRFFDWDWLDGGEGNDIISGGAGDDWIFGGGGDDKLYGDAGNDILVGGTGKNIINGGDGFDRVDYTYIETGITLNLEKTSFQYIAPGVMDKIVSVEQIWGTYNYDDKIIGNNDKNIIEGFGGNDTIHGKGGNDEICGGSGQDLISGGSGNDILFGDDSYFEYPLTDIDYYFIDERLYDDKLYGGDGNDFLVGGWGQDVLYGGDGNDWLIGSYYLDSTTLWEPSSNKLYGGNGNDVLISGSNNDRLEGGEGADIFLFEAPQESSGTVRIVDFNPDENDKIAFYTDVVGASLQDFYQTFFISSYLHQEGKDTYVNFWNSTPIILEDVQLDSLNPDDFISIERKHFDESLYLFA